MITLTVLCQDGTKEKIEDVVPQSNDRKWCAENALFTVDGISFFPAYGIDNKPFTLEVFFFLHKFHKIYVFDSMPFLDKLIGSHNVSWVVIPGYHLERSVFSFFCSLTV